MSINLSTAAGIQQTVIVSLEDQKKKWRDFDDDRRQYLKVHISPIFSLPGHSQLPHIGGGLLAGAATVDSSHHAWDGNKGRSEEEVSLLPYSHSDFSLLTLIEETNPHGTWGLQGWHKNSYARTEEFRNHGPRAPTTWVLVDGRDKIPKSAIEVGRDKDNHPIYIARAYYEDSFRTFFDLLLGCLFKPH